MDGLHVFLIVGLVITTTVAVAALVVGICAWSDAGSVGTVANEANDRSIELAKVRKRHAEADRDTVAAFGKYHRQTEEILKRLEGAQEKRDERLAKTESDLSYLAEIVCGVGDAGGHFHGGLDEKVAENAKALAELAKGPPSDGALKACVEELEKRLEDRRACTCRAFEQVDRRIDDLEARYAIDLTLDRIREGLAHAIGVELPAVAETQPTEKLFVRRELIITNDERSNRAVSDAIVGLIGKPGVCFEKVEEQIRPVVDPDAETETNIQPPASIFPDATGDSIAEFPTGLEVVGELVGPDGTLPVPIVSGDSLRALHRASDEWMRKNRDSLTVGNLVTLPDGATFSTADDNAHASNDGFEMPDPVYGLESEPIPPKIQERVEGGLRARGFEPPAPMQKFATEGVDL